MLQWVSSSRAIAPEIPGGEAMPSRSFGCPPYRRPPSQFLGGAPRPATLGASLKAPKSSILNILCLHLSKGFALASLSAPLRRPPSCQGLTPVSAALLPRSPPSVSSALWFPSVSWLLLLASPFSTPFLFSPPFLKLLNPTPQTGVLVPQSYSGICRLTTHPMASRSCRVTTRVRRVAWTRPSFSRSRVQPAEHRRHRHASSFMVAHCNKESMLVPVKATVTILLPSSIFSSFPCPATAPAWPK